MMKNNDKLINNLTFSDRVSVSLKNIDRSKSWLAEGVGISRQALNYLLSKSSGGKYTSKIAEVLNVNPEWLETGEGEVTLTENHSNLIPLLNPYKVIPWLNGRFNESYDTISVDFKDNYDAFSIILDNTNMESEFVKDSILIFKASLQPINGDYVMALLNRENKNPVIIFRKYITDGTGIYLKVLDTTFRTISETEDFEIIGVLIEQRRMYRG